MDKKVIYILAFKCIFIIVSIYSFYIFDPILKYPFGLRFALFVGFISLLLYAIDFGIKTKYPTENNVVNEILSKAIDNGYFIPIWMMLLMSFIIGYFAIDGAQQPLRPILTVMFLIGFAYLVKKLYFKKIA